MQIVSIDIETTGTDAAVDQVIEFGAIIYDFNEKKERLEDCKTFRRILKHQRYSGNAFAINLNQRIFQILAGIEKQRGEKEKLDYMDANSIIDFWNLATEFHFWLYKNCIWDGTGSAEELYVKGPNKEKISINAAGKNFGTFDKNFLDRLPGWDKFFRVRQRILDPAILWADLKKDKELPNMEECKRRAGFANTEVSHCALDDAWDVIKLIEVYNEKCGA